LYEDAVAFVNGPTLWPSIGANGLIMNLTYNASRGVFDLGNGQNASIATLDMFDTSMQGVVMYALDPLGSGDMVLLNGSQWSMPSPVAVSSWQLSIRMLLVDAPASAYWWRLNASPILDTIVMQFNSDGTELCLVVNLAFVSVNLESSTSVGCFAPLGVALNTYNNYDWLIDSGGTQLTMYVNGVSLGSLTLGTGASANLTGVIAFQIPKFYYPYRVSGFVPFVMKRTMLFETTVYVPTETLMGSG